MGVSITDLSISQLLAMPQILFAGYKVPHPLRPYFQLKVQTDGSSTPTEILQKACERLIGTLSTIEQTFKREFSYKEQEGAGADTGVDAYGVGTGGVGMDGAGGAGGWDTGRDYLDF